MSTLRSRRAIAGLALLAMLAFALLPTLSRALASSGATVWAEVCTPQGTRWSRLAAGDDAGGTPAPRAVLDACVLCALASEGAAPLPACAPAQALAPHGASAAGPVAPGPATRPAWRRAQPRGPPALA